MVKVPVKATKLVRKKSGRAKFGFKKGSNFSKTTNQAVHDKAVPKPK